MKIHEYQARELFAKQGIPVPAGELAQTAEEAEQIAIRLNKKVVLKAQVHVGGRGKAGGVKLAKTPAEAKLLAGQILGMNIKGCIVRKLWVTEAIDIAKEFYIGLTIDQSRQKLVFMVSQSGGVDIEEVAAKTPEKIIKVYINPLLGIQDFHLRQLTSALFQDRAQSQTAAQIFKQLYQVFTQADCSLAEINPLVVTSSGQVIAADAKVIIDDNALDKHPELELLRDLDEEDLDELEAKKTGLSFIKLDGKIGCIVNGAGLAMATMDCVKLFGGEPANFLDVGGSSNPQKIIKAFTIILKNPDIKAVLVNIFGGITRCDDIANGLIEARKQMNIEIPVVIRLAGTNADIARDILKSQNISAYTSMEDAVREVVALAKIPVTGNRSQVTKVSHKEINN